MIPRNLNNEPEDPDKPTFEELQKEFKRDQKFMDTSYPEEWDKLFHVAMEHGKKRRTWQKRIKVAAMAASVLLLVGIFGMIQYKQVYGGNLMEVFKKWFSEYNQEYILDGTESDTGIILEETKFEEILFDDTTLDSLQQSIRQELKRPMFYFADVFEDYEIIEAKYNHTFQVLAITLKTTDGFIYIFQNDSYRNTGNGTYFENDPIDKVHNQYLVRDIDIHESTEEAEYHGYSFKVQSGNSWFLFDGAITLEQCKLLAQSLYYK